MKSKNHFRTWLLGLLSAITVIALTACGGTWYGEGTVVGKSYIDGTVITQGHHESPKFQGECFHLQIRDRYDEMQEGCVSERVWENAMIGHHIKITEDYK